jgi:hypothetical protein
MIFSRFSVHFAVFFPFSRLISHSFAASFRYFRRFFPRAAAFSVASVFIRHRQNGFSRDARAAGARNTAQGVRVVLYRAQGVAGGGGGGWVFHRGFLDKNALILSLK